MFDFVAVKQTTKLNKEKQISCLLVNTKNMEVFRFLIPVTETSGEWNSNFTEISPYKKYTLLSFQNRGSDKFSFDSILTTPSRIRSIQPILNKLKACMIPPSAANSALSDQIDPPILSLVLGNIQYKNLYLSNVRVNVRERFNGDPIYADVSLSFVSPFIETSTI